MGIGFDDDIEEHLARKRAGRSELHGARHIQDLARRSYGCKYVWTYSRP